MDSAGRAARLIVKNALFRATGKVDGLQPENTTPMINGNE